MSITSYKGFNADMTCRGFQFAVGGTYTHEGKVDACASGFHACEYPLDVLRYYPPNASVFAEVVQDGDISRHLADSKIASSVLHVKASLSLSGLIKAAIDYTFSRSVPEGMSATGERGAASATSERGAASATGYQGAASATGYQGKVKGAIGNALFLIERGDLGNIVAVGAAIVGQKGILPDVWYILKDGEFVKL
jgi:hypothetical protein